MRPLAALLLAALPALAQAQELVTEVEPAERTTSRVMLLVDTSGSMKPGKLPLAIDAALRIARQGGDELEIAAYSFAAGFCRWPVPLQEDAGDVVIGWARMPDERALAALLAWLQAPVVSDASTSLGPALKDALADRRDKLTVIVITDGILDDGAAVLEALQDGQAEREKDGRGRAVVACLGIGSDAPPLKALAEAGRGGYWRVPLEAPAHPLPTGAPGVQGSAR